MNPFSEQQPSDIIRSGLGLLVQKIIEKVAHPLILTLARV